MQIKEASRSWNISERRIRKLIDDGRIDGATKIGTTWTIPDDANKPVDKRFKELIEYKINIPDNYFEKVDNKLEILNSRKPLNKELSKSLKDAINLEWTYNSNGIEGNSLTLKETKVVLEGITIGGKSVREHLEAINHENAIEYLEELIGAKSEISEWNIKGLHQLVLKGIDDENAGKYSYYGNTLNQTTITLGESSIDELFDILFDVKSKDLTQFMLRSIPIREKWRSRIPAVCHVDGTTRPQRLERDINPEYYDMIMEFYKLTELPCVINTSFNGPGEPIIENPKEALDFLDKTPELYGIVFNGKYLCRKR